MKKVVKWLSLILVFVLLGLVAACGGNTDPGENDQNEFDRFYAVESEFEEDEFDERLLFDQEFVEEQYLGSPTTDWSAFPILVNGVGVQSQLYNAPGHDFPTHVSMGDIVGALGGNFFIVGFEPLTLRVEGLNGEIIFDVGSATFYLEGAPITLEMESLDIGGFTFVPFSFFTDVFGADTAEWSDGQVHVIAQVN